MTAISGRRVFGGASLILSLLLSCSAIAQQSAPQASTSDSGSATDQNLSLGELARKARKDHTKEVQMSEADAKELFQSVDKILAFASEDTGFPKRANVKRRLVGSGEVEKYTREQTAKDGYAQRFARSEMTMKKFGLLPRDFNLREFLVKANGKQIAAYYDFDTKTISMLNWIPRGRQEPILAHELTHALQDQNYDLRKWLLLEPEGSETTAKHHSDTEITDDSPTARRAVTEGQAQVVFVDYLLAPYKRSVQNTPALIYEMEEPAVKAAADSELLHDAPMIVREMGTFPYRAGLIFEGELLQKGGKQMAFAGAFAHPPRTTHEVLQPKAYMDHEKTPLVQIPDVQSLLGDKYSEYDSGGVGELDVRALLEQFGERKTAADLASAWMGGRYVAFRKTSENGAAKELTTGDLALLYVSHWKSPQAAQRFAKIYAAAVAQRYQGVTPQPVAYCNGTPCQRVSAQIATEEGPVIVEQAEGNTVLVSESFDQTTATKLLNAIKDGKTEAHAGNFSQDELSLRFYEVPGFSAFQAQIGETIREQLVRRIGP